MKYAIIVPFNYKKVEFDTIKSITENTKPLLYYQLDLLINKLGFDKVFVIHNHENVSELVEKDFNSKYEFVHPFDLEFSKEEENLYYLKSLALAISRVPDSAKELYILGDNILIDPIVNFELMTYNGNKYKFISFINSNFSRGMYSIEFDSSISDDYSIDVTLPSCNDISKVELLPAFIVKGFEIELLKIKFSDSYGSELIDNIVSLSKNKDFKVYSISPDDFRKFYSFNDFVKFRLEMNDQ